jgi:hypothetical protein
MLLQEEYLKRHGINIKPIYYTRKANLVLKLKSRPQVVVELSWENTSRRPGYFVFNFLNPNHNGYLDGNYFIQLGDAHYYQYDEYAAFIIRWSRGLNFSPIRSNQIRLAVWEMFLYCFDGWIAEHDLEDMAFRVANLSLSEEERLYELDVFLDYLANYDTLVMDIYNSEFRNYEDYYADWLADLIEFGTNKEV